MAMNTNDLKTALYAQLKSDMWLSDYGDDELDSLSAFCGAISNVLLNYITANAVVTSDTISIGSLTGGTLTDGRIE